MVFTGVWLRNLVFCGLDGLNCAWSGGVLVRRCLVCCPCGALVYGSWLRVCYRRACGFTMFSESGFCLVIWLFVSVGVFLLCSWFG